MSVTIGETITLVLPGFPGEPASIATGPNDWSSSVVLDDVVLTRDTTGLSAGPLSVSGTYQRGGDDIDFDESWTLVDAAAGSGLPANMLESDGAGGQRLTAAALSQSPASTVTGGAGDGIMKALSAAVASTSADLLTITINPLPVGIIEEGMLISVESGDAQGTGRTVARVDGDTIHLREKLPIALAAGVQLTIKHHDNKVAERK